MSIYKKMPELPRYKTVEAPKLEQSFNPALQDPNGLFFVMSDRWDYARDFARKHGVKSINKIMLVRERDSITGYPRGHILHVLSNATRIRDWALILDLAKVRGFVISDARPYE